MLSFQHEKARTFLSRLETDQKEGIERICAALGLATSAIIRILVKSLVDHYGRNKGKVEFPLNLSK